MAKPSPNDIDLDACFQQVDGRGMSQGVGENAAVTFSQGTTLQTSRVSLHDLVDSKPCERLALL